MSHTKEAYDSCFTNLIRYFDSPYENVHIAFIVLIAFSVFIVFVAFVSSVSLVSLVASIRLVPVVPVVTFLAFGRAFFDSRKCVYHCISNDNTDPKIPVTFQYVTHFTAQSRYERNASHENLS